MIEFELKKDTPIIYPAEKQTKKKNAIMWDEIDHAMEAAIDKIGKITGIDFDAIDLDKMYLIKQCVEVLNDLITDEGIVIQFVDEDL